MKRTLLCIAIASVALFNSWSCRAQSVSQDSIAFVSAAWDVSTSPSGIKKAEAVMTLFDSPQSMSYLQFPASAFTMTLVPHDVLKKVSETAVDSSAVAAINAGYWNMSTDTPATYIRVNGKDMSQTEDCEVYRVNGMVIFDEGKFDIAYCDTTQYADLASKYDNILTCGPLLIDDSQAYDYSNGNGFFTHRHPRSVIGTTPAGDVIFLVVDGRIKDHAAGVSIPELTEICQWLGMTDALNLDGGGSSAIWLEGIGVVNHPSDNKSFDHEGERNVSSSIIVKRR